MICDKEKPPSITCWERRRNLEGVTLRTPFLCVTGRIPQWEEEVRGYEIVILECDSAFMLVGESIVVTQKEQCV